MKKSFFAIITATFMLLSACAGGYTAEHPRNENEPPTTFIATAPVAAISDISTIPNDTWTAISNFSQELFLQALAADNVDCENIVISPLSAYYALTMVALGARGTTLDEFAYILGQDPSTLAPELAGLALSLMDVSGSTLLTLAGSVWIRDDFTVHPDFNQVMIDYFGAPAFPRSFDQSTVDEINSWISYQTNGLIEEMLEEIENEMMFLINTLYLLAKWAERFYPMTESVRGFTPESGIEQDANFVSTRIVGLDVNVTDTYEAVLLPYDDGRLGFFMVRPTDGTLIRDFATMHYLADIFASLQRNWNVIVHMPELDKEFEIVMNDMLKAMGLNEAFTASADLFGLVEYMPLLGDWLEISSVRQMVRIIVDKEGTEAAAATIVGAQPASAPPPPLVLDFNTPYIYAIYDLKTGIPLFIGIVDYPNS